VTLPTPVFLRPRRAHIHNLYIAMVRYGPYGFLLCSNHLTGQTGITLFYKGSAPPAGLYDEPLLSLTSTIKSILSLAVPLRLCATGRT
jgi:hypothetical protein